MDVTPQLLHEIEFREAKRGGYDTRDVDEFLEKLAVGVDQLIGQVREARQRAESAEARAADADRRATETGEADETLKRTLVLAQRTADAAIKDAEEQAAGTLTSAQDEANRLLSEAREASARARAEAEAQARQAHEEAQQSVLAELQQLEQTRDEAKSNVEALEQHLEAQRERVRASLHELQALLDDPDALQAVPAPVVASAADTPSGQPGAQAEEDEGEGWSAEEAEWPDRDEDTEPDDGQSTQPVAVADAADERDDDAYLAEVRRAMADERPPELSDLSDMSEAFEEASSPAPRSRFGRRR